MATRKPRRFEGGGEILPKEVDSQEAADKAAGLKASKDEDVGFFGRLRMGNIDDPSSEAYKRFGAGRGRAERVPVEDLKPKSVVRESAKAEVDPLEEANKRENLDTTPGPRATSSTKPVARPSALPPRVEKKEAPESYKKIERQRDTVPFVKVPAKPIYSNEGYGKGKANADYGNEGRRRRVDPLERYQMDREEISSRYDNFARKGPLSSVRRPGTNTNYENENATSETFKRGGAVKKMAGGGMATSASRRADGIATKGKTRGRMC